MANLSNINNILRVSSSGVGINKNNTGPSELDIESAGADMIDMTRTGQKTYRFAISGASAFSLFDVAANADRLVIDSSGNTTFAGNVTVNGTYFTLGGQGYIRSDDSGYLHFQGGTTGTRFFNNANNTALFTILNNGNATFAGSVGINTAPQFNRELLVKGEISALAQDSGDNQLLFAASSTQTNISATYGSSGSYVPMQFETGGAIRLTIDSSGNSTFAGDVFLRGTYNPYSAANRGNITLNGTVSNIVAFTDNTIGKGYIYHNGTDFEILNAAAGVLKFSTNGTERMNINNSGNATFLNNLAIGYAVQTNIKTFVYDNSADYGLVVQQDGSGIPFQVTSGGNIRMIVANNGNVGIGTTSPNSNGGASARVLHIHGPSSGDWAVTHYTNSDTGLAAGDGTVVGVISSSKDMYMFNYEDSNIILATNGSERMRITSGGDVLIGTTATRPDANSDTGVQISPGGKFYIYSTSDFGVYNTNTTGKKIYFRVSGAEKGSIQFNTNSVAYNTSSDYRLKENVVEMTGALDRVSQLKPSRFNLISDADKTVDGFLAHEVQDIVPEAISGEKDAMRNEEYEVTPAVYENIVHPAEEAVYETIEYSAIEEELDDEGNVIVEGKEAYTEEVLVTEAKEEWTEKVLVSEKVMGTREVPDYQGIDQSKLVPLLVGAIQELKADNDSLKARIETLENK